MRRDCKLARSTTWTKASTHFCVPGAACRPLFVAPNAPAESETSEDAADQFRLVLSGIRERAWRLVTTARRLSVGIDERMED